MPDNVSGGWYKGKTVNLAHTEDFDESQSQVDESFYTVTFGSDGKAEVAAVYKAAVLLLYPGILAED